MKRAVIAIIIVLILGLCFLAIRPVLPGGSGIVARVTATDGTEMCVVQRYNDTITEPYTVSFYYRKPGQKWGWFYYDHEDTRWSSAKIAFSPDNKLAHIFRGQTEVARFEMASESFTILRGNRTLSPAQEWMPDGWQPEDVIDSKRALAAAPVSRGAPNNSPPMDASK